jgi:hypothetical protein
MRPVLPIDDDLLAREMPKVFLRCLGVEEATQRIKR